MKYGKKELEIFPRKYEHFFSDPDKWMKSCNPYNITVTSPYSKPLGGPLDQLEEYQKDFSVAMREVEKTIWEAAVVYLWYRKRFGYLYRSYTHGDWDRNTNYAYGIFLRQYIDLEKTLIFSRESSLPVVRRYYDDFIDSVFDPRKERAKFPYKNIALTHMALVQEMEERLELLDYAEENKMKYVDFCDFVANWVSCYNEKYGEKYQLQLKRSDRMVGVVNLSDGKKRSTRKYEY